MAIFRQSKHQDGDARPADALAQEPLTALQRRILQNRGTERPYSGDYVDHYDDGIYTCANCDANLFRSESKFESTTPGLMGWPAFSDIFDPDSVELRRDNSLGMERTEVICKRCGGHLGHLFDDPAAPNHIHYCVNSACLLFKGGRGGPHEVG